jgi:hypothetical protein
MSAIISRIRAGSIASEAMCASVAAGPRVSNDGAMIGQNAHEGAMHAQGLAH